MTAELDHMYAAGVYAMISIPTAGHCNQTAKPGKPVPNCTAEYENMLGNMTLVKEHPATWGYYICDDCKILTLSRCCAVASSQSVTIAGCAGWEYLQELSVVYQQIKAIVSRHGIAAS